MATRNLGQSAIGTGEITLTANEVETITWPVDLGMVQVILPGTAKVAATVDGTTPALTGTGSFVIPAGVVEWKIDPATLASDEVNAKKTVVKLLCASAITVVVQRVG